MMIADVDCASTLCFSEAVVDSQHRTIATQTRTAASTATFVTGEDAVAPLTSIGCFSTLPVAVPTDGGRGATVILSDPEVSWNGRLCLTAVLRPHSGDIVVVQQRRHHDRDTSGECVATVPIRGEILDLVGTSIGGKSGAFFSPLLRLTGDDGKLYVVVAAGNRHRAIIDVCCLVNVVAPPSPRSMDVINHNVDEEEQGTVRYAVPPDAGGSHRQVVRIEDTLLDIRLGSFTMGRPLEDPFASPSSSSLSAAAAANSKGFAASVGGPTAPQGALECSGSVLVALGCDATYIIDPRSGGDVSSLPHLGARAVSVTSLQDATLSFIPTTAIPSVIGGVIAAVQCTSLLLMQEPFLFIAKAKTTVVMEPVGAGEAAGARTGGHIAAWEAAKGSLVCLSHMWGDDGDRDACLPCAATFVRQPKLPGPSSVIMTESPWAAVATRRGVGLVNHKGRLVSIFSSWSVGVIARLWAQWTPSLNRADGDGDGDGDDGEARHGGLASVVLRVAVADVHATGCGLLGADLSGKGYGHSTVWEAVFTERQEEGTASMDHVTNAPRAAQSMADRTKTDPPAAAAVGCWTSDLSWVVDIPRSSPAEDAPVVILDPFAHSNASTSSPCGVLALAMRPAVEPSGASPLELALIDLLSGCGSSPMTAWVAIGGLDSQTTAAIPTSSPTSLSFHGSGGTEGGGVSCSTLSVSPPPGPLDLSLSGSATKNMRVVTGGALRPVPRFLPGATTIVSDAIVHASTLAWLGTSAPSDRGVAGSNEVGGEVVTTTMRTSMVILSQNVSSMETIAVAVDPFTVYHRLRWIDAQSAVVLADLWLPAQSRSALSLLHPGSATMLVPLHVRYDIPTSLGGKQDINAQSVSPSLPVVPSEFVDAKATFTVLAGCTNGDCVMLEWRHVPVKVGSTTCGPWGAMPSEEKGSSPTPDDCFQRRGLIISKVDAPTRTIIADTSSRFSERLVCRLCAPALHAFTEFPEGVSGQVPHRTTSLTWVVDGRGGVTQIDTSFRNDNVCQSGSEEERAAKDNASCRVTLQFTSSISMPLVAALSNGVVRYEFIFKSGAPSPLMVPLRPEGKVSPLAPGGHPWVVDDYLHVASVLRLTAAELFLLRFFPATMDVLMRSSMFIDQLAATSGSGGGGGQIPPVSIMPGPLRQLVPRLPRFLQKRIAACANNVTGTAQGFGRTGSHSLAVQVERSSGLDGGTQWLTVVDARARLVSSTHFNVCDPSAPDLFGHRLDVFNAVTVATRMWHLDNGAELYNGPAIFDVHRLVPGRGWVATSSASPRHGTITSSGDTTTSWQVSHVSLERALWDALRPVGEGWLLADDREAKRYPLNHHCLLSVHRRRSGAVCGHAATLRFRLGCLGHELLALSEGKVERTAATTSIPPAAIVRVLGASQLRPVGMRELPFALSTLRVPSAKASSSPPLEPESGIPIAAIRRAAKVMCWKVLMAKAVSVAATQTSTTMTTKAARDGSQMTASLPPLRSSLQPAAALPNDNEDGLGILRQHAEQVLQALLTATMASRSAPTSGPAREGSSAEGTADAWNRTIVELIVQLGDLVTGRYLPIARTALNVLRFVCRSFAFPFAALEAVMLPLCGMQRSSLPSSASKLASSGGVGGAVRGTAPSPPPTTAADRSIARRRFTFAFCTFAAQHVVPPHGMVAGITGDTIDATRQHSPSQDAVDASFDIISAAVQRLGTKEEQCVTDLALCQLLKEVWPRWNKSSPVIQGLRTAFMSKLLVLVARTEDELEDMHRRVAEPNGSGTAAVPWGSTIVFAGGAEIDTILDLTEEDGGRQTTRGDDADADDGDGEDDHGDDGGQWTSSITPASERSSILLNGPFSRQGATTTGIVDAESTAGRCMADSFVTGASNNGSDFLASFLAKYRTSSRFDTAPLDALLDQRVAAADAVVMSICSGSPGASPPPGGTACLARRLELFYSTLAVALLTNIVGFVDMAIELGSPAPLSALITGFHHSSPANGGANRNKILEVALNALSRAVDIDAQRFQRGIHAALKLAWHCVDPHAPSGATRRQCRDAVGGLLRHAAAVLPGVDCSHETQRVAAAAGDDGKVVLYDVKSTAKAAVITIVAPRSSMGHASSDDKTAGGNGVDFNGVAAVRFSPTLPDDVIVLLGSLTEVHFYSPQRSFGSFLSAVVSVAGPTSYGLTRTIGISPSKRDAIFAGGGSKDTSRSSSAVREVSTTGGDDSSRSSSPEQRSRPTVEGVRWSDETLLLLTRLLPVVSDDDGAAAVGGGPGRYLSVDVDAAAIMLMGTGGKSTSRSPNSAGQLASYQVTGLRFLSPKCLEVRFRITDIALGVVRETGFQIPTV